MTRTKTIEALEAKLGRLVTLDDWRAMWDKPAAQLTDDDIALSEYFDGVKSGAAVRARRTAALNPAALTDDDIQLIRDRKGEKDAERARAQRALAKGATASMGGTRTRGGDKPLTILAFLKWVDDFKNNLADDIVDVIKATVFGPLVKGRLDAQDARIAELETQSASSRGRINDLENKAATSPAGLAERVKSIESRPYLLDGGVWNPSRTYQPGDLVSWSGSGWIAHRSSTGDPPGSGNGAWRLAIKRGRDGRVR